MFRTAFSKAVCLAMAFTLLACLAGCPTGTGPNYPDTAPVTGTVIYQDKPLEGVTVTFSPEGGGHPALGTTDAQGRFSLKTPWGADGAVPGNYKVLVARTGAVAANEPAVEVDAEMPEDKAPEEEDTEEPPEASPQGLPAKYASAETTDLTAEVKPGGPNDFKFELTD